MSPNYPGEEFETPDRQILVISADVLPQDGETDKQRQECEMLRLQEPSNDSKKSAPLPQVQAYNQLTPDKSTPTPDRSTPTPGNKYLWHQLLHSSNAKMMYLMPTDCVREISSGTSSATDSKYTNHRKLTWGPLLPLSTTSKIPQ
jgi:hypothetical protein